MQTQPEFVVEVLLGLGVVSQAEVRQARERAKGSGIGVVETLIQMGRLSQKTLTKALANQVGMETIDLSQVSIPAGVIATIPSDIALQHRIVPVYRHDNTLIVATDDPLDTEKIKSLPDQLKVSIEVVACCPSDIDFALQRYYAHPSPTFESEAHGTCFEESAPPKPAEPRSLGLFVVLAILLFLSFPIGCWQIFTEEANGRIAKLTKHGKYDYVVFMDGRELDVYRFRSLIPMGDLKPGGIIEKKKYSVSYIINGTPYNGIWYGYGSLVGVFVTLGLILFVTVGSVLLRWKWSCYPDIKHLRHVRTLDGGKGWPPPRKLG